MSLGNSFLYATRIAIDRHSGFMQVMVEWGELTLSMSQWTEPLRVLDAEPGVR